MSITPAQAATRLIYALVPVATLITLKAQVERADTTITRVEEILLKSETELKEAREGAVCLSRDLNKCLKENITLQQEIIRTNNHPTTTHEDYAQKLEGVAHAIIQSRDRIRELEAENAQIYPHRIR